LFPFGFLYLFLVCMVILEPSFWNAYMHEIFCEGLRMSLLACIICNQDLHLLLSFYTVVISVNFSVKSWNINLFFVQLIYYYLNLYLEELIPTLILGPF
jgi:hypothetical protein